MRLYVAVIAPEQFFQPVAGKIFRNVHKLTAAVIPLPGQSFGIFVGEMGPCRRKHCGRNDVLAGDQLEIAPLPFQLRVHRGIQLRIGFFNDAHIDHADTSCPLGTSLYFCVNIL